VAALIRPKLDIAAWIRSIPAMVTLILLRLIDGELLHPPNAVLLLQPAASPLLLL
jgi:hypothetical protein